MNFKVFFSFQLTTNKITERLVRYCYSNASDVKFDVQSRSQTFRKNTEDEYNKFQSTKFMISNYIDEPADILRAHVLICTQEFVP